MAIRLPPASRNAGANAVADLLDGGPAPGTIDIRTGAQPAAATDAASGTLLATLTLNDPAFGAAVNGVKTLSVAPAVTTPGIAAGTAAWFRAKDSTGATVMDGAITATGGGGDLTLSTTAISVGLTVRITGGTVTMPG